MTDLYHPSLPYAQDRQRERNARPDSMPCITTIPARDRCHVCGKTRTAASGKYSKSGKFTCVMCHSPRRVS